MRIRTRATIRACLLTVAACTSLALAVTPADRAHASTPLPTAISDCRAGYFCVWSGTNFTGTIQRISATNSYRPISVQTSKSYYNNRAYRTWLHSDPAGDGSRVCIGPRASKPSTSGWQSVANAAYLATITSC